MDNYFIPLFSQGSCCQKSWFDQKHLALLLLGLILGFVASVDLAMWSLALAIGSVAVILNCFLDYAELLHVVGRVIKYVGLVL